MPRLRAILLAFALSACTPSAGAPSLAPPLSNAPTAGAPGPSGACIDPVEFSDNAESVVAVLQSVSAALKLSKTDEARTAAGTAATGLRNLAALVDPVQPEAAADFRTAATELDSAVTQFPGGQSLVDQAQADMS